MSVLRCSVWLTDLIGFIELTNATYGTYKHPLITYVMHVISQLISDLAKFGKLSVRDVFQVFGEKTLFEIMPLTSYFITKPRFGMRL